MNMIIEEEVLVPDIPIIEEQVLYPDNPISVEEEVLVPATIPAPNEVEKVIDPAWRDYVYNVEDEYINVIVTQYKNIEPLICLNNYNSTYQVFSINGEIITPTTYKNYKIILMNNYKETGLDSLGRKFWVLKFTNTEEAKKSNIFFLQFFSRITYFYEFTSLINSSLTFISVGDKIFTEKRYATRAGQTILYTYQSNYNLLGIKIKGSYLYKLPTIEGTLHNNFRGIIFDEGVKLEYFPEDHINEDRIVYWEDGLFGLTWFKQIEVIEGSLIPFSLTMRSIAGDYNKIDLTKYRFRVTNPPGQPFNGCLPTFGYYSYALQELIYPREPYLGDSVYDTNMSCYRLKKLIFPPSMPYIYNAGYFLYDCHNLEELYIPEDFGSLSERGTTMGQVFHLYLPEFILNIPGCKLLNISITYSSIKGIKFSKESPFVYNNSYTNVFSLSYTAISREAIVDIFNQLPDFTGQPTRTMNLVGSPYASELTEEDLKIAINKNWVINR